MSFVPIKDGDFTSTIYGMVRFFKVEYNLNTVYPNLRSKSIDMLKQFEFYSMNFKELPIVKPLFPFWVTVIIQHKIL